MKKRIQLSLFLEDITGEELSLLKALKARSSNVQLNNELEEKSFAHIHDCGHDEGKPCRKKEVL